MKADALPGNPLFEGSVRAHEYHYSEVIASEKDTFGFEVKRGLGIIGKKDGLVFRNTMGSCPFEKGQFYYCACRFGTV